MAAEDALKRVTTTLADLLKDRMARVESITFGLPRPGAADGGGRLNLFLYRVAENAAFRNDEDPRRAVAGQYGSPPLALELSYLLTSYGAAAPAPAGLTADSAAELDAQWIMADAMRVLHDVPIVTRRTPRQRGGGVDGLLLDLGLRSEFESLRIAPHALSLDDLSKLWTAFKEDFQRSVAYDVSVVRVERPQPQTAGPPVLGRAIDARPTVAIGPVLTGLDPASDAAGEQITLLGDGLAAASVTVLVSDAAATGYPLRPFSFTVVPDAAGVHFIILAATVDPDDPAKLAFLPGPKLVVARVLDAALGHPLTSNAALLSLLPGVTAIAPATGLFDGVTTVTITGTLLGVAPDPTVPANPLVPTVLFGSYAIPAADVDYTGLPNSLKVTLSPAAAPTDPQPPPAGRVVPVRVRVNGVESRAWRVNPATQALEMDPALQFTVT